MTKTALITGASRGIGKDIALRLASDGYNIALNYRSNEDQALDVKKEIEGLGVHAEIFKADVSDYDQCQDLVDRVIERFEKIYCLVNNAGITRDNLIMRMSVEDYQDVIGANLDSAFYMMKLLSRHMMKNRQGSIINMSSVVGLHGNAGQVNYAASKAGLIGMTKSLAKELGSRGVRVNAVAPGFIESDMTQSLNEDIVQAYKAQIPLGHFGTSRDVSNLVAFLASEDSAYITGQVISVDGGMSS